MTLVHVIVRCYGREDIPECPCLVGITFQVHSCNGISYIQYCEHCVPEPKHGKIRPTGKVFACLWLVEQVCSGLIVSHRMHKCSVVPPGSGSSLQPPASSLQPIGNTGYNDAPMKTMVSSRLRRQPGSQTGDCLMRACMLVMVLSLGGCGMFSSEPEQSRRSADQTNWYQCRADAARDAWVCVGSEDTPRRVPSTGADPHDDRSYETQTETRSTSVSSPSIRTN